MKTRFQPADPSTPPKSRSMEFTFREYRARYSPTFGEVRLYCARNKNLYYWMSLLSRVDKMGAVDRTLGRLEVRVISRPKESFKLSVLSQSSLWDRKEGIYEFRPDGVEYRLKVWGKGTLDRVYFFMGLLQDRVIGSAPGFDHFYSAGPNFIGNKYFAPHQYCSNHVGLETTHWGPALNSGPFLYAFAREGVKHCISVGLVARQGDNQFQCFDFNHQPREVMAAHDQIVNTQSFSIGYYGAVRVDGEWESPRLLFQFGKDQYDCLRKYCRFLERQGAIARPAKGQGYSWWKKPIFCGWHEQVAVALKRLRDQKISKTETETGRDMFNECTQKNYRKWVDTLLDKQVPIGTVIIDAAWQRRLGSFAVDIGKWPDMRGFVQYCHRHGLKVMLWIQAWSMEGLRARECMRKDGTAVAGDPTSAAYRKRLENGVEFMLSDQAECLNADGLKIDGTVGIPIGYGVKNHRGIYGFELQHHYLEVVYQKAKSVKKDACISLYIANPYFRDVCDVVRVGDLYSVQGRPVDTMKERARVMQIAMQGKPIDTDGTFRFTMAENFLAEFKEQARIGIPTIYQAETVCQLRTFNAAVYRTFTNEDYRSIGKIMRRYLRRGK